MIACVSGGELVVLAQQSDNAIHFWFKNNSKKVIVLGDPLKSGMIIKVESDRISGGLDSSIPISLTPWKHLIVLAPVRENKPHLWTHKISLKADQNLIGKIEKMDIMMWFATEEEFRRKALGVLNLTQIDVKLLEGKRTDGSLTD
jgi:hypothetical protein